MHFAGLSGFGGDEPERNRKKNRNPHDEEELGEEEMEPDSPEEDELGELPIGPEPPEEEQGEQP